MFSKYNDYQIVGLLVALTGVVLMALDIAGLHVNFGYVAAFGLCFGLFGPLAKKSDSSTRQKDNMKTFRIFHLYDIGDRGIYIRSTESEDSLLDTCAYMQFALENHIDEGADLENMGAANALVKYFGCKPGAKDNDATPIDLYSARESRITPEMDELIERYDNFIGNKMEQFIADLACHTDV